MALGMSVFGVFFSLFLLVVLTYKGLHLSWVSIIAALVIMVTSGLVITESWDNLIAAGIGQMAGTLIPLFVAGATFGKIVAVSGAADSFANFALKFSDKMNDKAKRLYGAFLVILLGILMVLGGVDNFAILFTQIAIAASIMHHVNIPRRFMCALIIIGSTAGGLLPGAPSMMNIIANQYLGTTATAAPILATSGSLFIIIFTLIGLSRMWEKAIANGENFDFGPLTQAKFDEDNLPPWFFLLVPIIIVFVAYNFLAIPIFFCMLIAVVVSSIMLFPYLPYEEGLHKNAVYARFASLTKQFNGGVELAGIPAIILINMALGNVISETPAFFWFVEIVSGVNGSPIILFTIIAIIIIGISASMSGMIVMFNLAATLFIPVMGLNPEVAHRIVMFSAVVLDTMPFGSMVVAILMLTGVKHDKGYPPVFFSSVGVTFFACIFIAILAMMGIR
ncbi:MAG: hypothetical protein ACK5LV_00135 [Lachnospirales bacterium]